MRSVRVDGLACTMQIVTGLGFAPSDAARELASLARRGIVRIVMPRAPDDDAPDLEIASISLG
jgi:hypothetical protein